MFDTRKTHSITVGGVNTWKRWGLILTEESTPPPEQIRKFIEVPGRTDRYLDYTHDITDADQFERRECSWKFDFCVKNASEFKRILREMSHVIRGFQKIYPSYEEGWHYEGYLSISEESLTGHHASITIKGDCAPYMFKNELTELHFNVSGNMNVTFSVGSMPTQIDVTGDAAFSVEDTDNDASISVTSSKGDSFTNPGQSEWHFNIAGTGNITFTYQEGRL